MSAGAVHGRDAGAPSVAGGAAYRIDGALVDDATFYRAACDPALSLVVEACAGAGKTWMLVSRILRALLAGAQAQQILAITFTRKAAGEMRSRLVDLLQDAVNGGEEGCTAVLRQRGLDEEAARAAAPRLAALAGELLGATRGVEIRTFHGWFGQLLRAAPQAVLEDLGLAAELNVLEDVEEIEPRLWRRFLEAVGADPGLRADHAALVQQRGRAPARDWLMTALRRRVEIERADRAGTLEPSVPDAASWDPVFGGLSDPAEAALTGATPRRLLALASLLGKGGARQQTAAQGIVRALDPGEVLSPRGRFDLLWAALHTGTGQPRKLWKDEPPAAFTDALEALARVRDGIEQQAAHEEHLRLVRLSRALLASYRALKRDEGLADMDDLERCAERLLADGEVSGWLQERLDARISHLLVDEFQDTNPTQWRALHAWLSGYAGAGGGASGRAPLSVFLVGDPKQSIYRFRRADPRVFGEARRFVEQALGGRHLSCDHTRRNAPAVLDVLNDVFGALHARGAFEGFRPHTTSSEAAGAVWRLPAAMRAGQAAKAPAAASWRDSLRVPRIEVEQALRMIEARRVAADIAGCLAGVDGLPPLPPGEIFVLARRRAPLVQVEQALREIGIPAVAPAEHPLADLPETRDLIALLDVLVSPRHDLSLAQALRSPVFGADDEDLQALALAVAAGRRPARVTPGAEDASPHGRVDVPAWWDVLMAGAGAGRPVLDRARALLPGWAEAARSLPPHDLIDRIFDEGDLPARTLAALPASQRSLARATLDALLWQALQLDGGRHATPYGFVRALKRRPLTLPPSAATGAVQLMTIHGAKGLEADAVFLVDGLPGPTKPGSGVLLVDWPADSLDPRGCAFVASETRCPPSLRSLLSDENSGRSREELNGLYVAMTRARRRLVVSAMEPHVWPQEPGPWQRLADAGVPQRAVGADADLHPAAVAAHEVALELPELPRIPMATGIPGGGTAAGLAGAQAGGDDAGGPRVREAAAADPGGEDTEAIRLGRAVHRVLEWLPPPERLDRACAAAAGHFGLPRGGAAEVRRVVDLILGSASCRVFFDPQRLEWAANELPLTWQGEVLRLDRLVRLRGDDGRSQWWVLDHKLQHAPQTVPENLAQLSRYREAVRALQPGEDVQAAFITGAGERVLLPP